MGGNQAPELIVGSTDKQPLIEAPGEVGCLTWGELSVFCVATQLQKMA